MKMKILALLLAVLMVFSCLTACGKTDAAADSAAETEEPAAAEQADTEDTPEEDAAAGPYTQMFADAYKTYAPDTVIATVNGAGITWDTYFFWIYETLVDLSSYGYDVTDFDVELSEGYTVGQYLHDRLESMILQYGIINAKAVELKVPLSAEQEASIADLMQSDADTYYDGDLDAMMEILSTMYMTEDIYRYVTATGLLYNNIFSYYLGENGAKVTDADVEAFAADNGLYKAKHILLKTVDDSNQALDDETKAAKKQTAEQLLAELKAVPAAELETRFDEMIGEYSEDLGSAYYPDGYYFGPGQAVSAFETATNALEAGQMSGIVESEYGYHIILRCAIDPDDIYNVDSSTLSTTTLRSAVAADLFADIANEWYDDVDLQYAEGTDELNFSELFVLPDSVIVATADTAEAPADEAEAADTAETEAPAE